jgi:hypothetical protein
MPHQNVYLLWITTGCLDEARLIGVYSTEERAAERIVRCRQLPGYSDHLVDFVISESEVDHNERSAALVEV